MIKGFLFSVIIAVSMVAGLILVTHTYAAPVDVIDSACQYKHEATACRDNRDEPQGGNMMYGPSGVLTRAARLIAYVVGVASVVMIIIGGFKYVTASGDPNNIKSAKDTILFAIVGILVAVTAQSIVVFVLQRLR